MKIVLFLGLFVCATFVAANEQVSLFKEKLINKDMVIAIKLDGRISCGYLGYLLRENAIKGSGCEDKKVEQSLVTMNQEVHSEKFLVLRGLKGKLIHGDVFFSPYSVGREWNVFYNGDIGVLFLEEIGFNKKKYSYFEYEAFYYEDVEEYFKLNPDFELESFLEFVKIKRKSRGQTNLIQRK